MPLTFHGDAEVDQHGPTGNASKPVAAAALTGGKAPTEAPKKRVRSKSA